MKHQPVPDPPPQLRNAYTVTIEHAATPCAAVIWRKSAMCNKNGQTVSVLSLRCLGNLAVQRVSLRGGTCCERA